MLIILIMFMVAIILKIKVYAVQLKEPLKAQKSKTGRGFTTQAQNAA